MNDDSEMYKKPYSYKKDDDVFHFLRKKIIAVIVLGFMVITGYNGFIAYNMKDDTELIREEISKANSTFENIKILNARLLNLEKKHDVLSNCVDYLEMQLLEKTDVDESRYNTRSGDFVKYKEKCENTMRLSQNVLDDLRKDY